MPAQWYSAPLMSQQAPVNPHPCQRFLDTHMQVWIRLLWGHCCFLLGPDVHEVSFVLSKSLFPLFCGSSVIKFHWPPKSNSLGVLPLPDLQAGKSVVSPRKGKKIGH